MSYLWSQSASIYPAVWSSRPGNRETVLLYDGPTFSLSIITGLMINGQR